MFSYLSPVQKGPPVTGWSLLLVDHFDILFILRIIFSVGIIAVIRIIIAGIRIGIVSGIVRICAVIVSGVIGIIICVCAVISIAACVRTAVI